MKVDLTKYGGVTQNQGNCGCYDEQTEVLTKIGWKFFKDLTLKDMILCFNPQNRELVYHNPNQIFEYNYSGEMKQIKTSKIDLLITPNHNMIICPWDNVKGIWSDNLIIKQANSLGWYFKIPCSGIWNCEELETFSLPGQKIGPYFNNYPNKNGILKRTESYGFRKAVEIPANDWIQFFGIYLAEGYTTKKQWYHIGIAAVKEPKKSLVYDILKKMPFHIGKGTNRFRIGDKRLCLYLEQFGQAREKFMPDYIKQLPPKQIELFLNAFGIGDGQWIDEQKTWRFTTSSKRLASDLQELILKTGKWAQIVFSKPKTTKIKNRIIKDNGSYSLYVSSKQTFSICRKNSIKDVSYKGKVYCAEVPTHAMVIRRNGKPIISGNSCTGYGTCKVFEINDNIKNGSYSKRSERDLFRCAGGSCSMGNTMENALNRTLVGIASIECCPNNEMPTGVDRPCGDKTCTDWYKTAKKALSWKKVSIDEAKSLMSAESPQAVVASMAVHQSFINYKSGSYHSLGVTDPIVGYHCIACVGFDDETKTVVLWNSWGDDWGHGNDCVAGGLCDILWSDSGLEFYQLVPDGEIPPGPEPQPTPSPCPFGNSFAKLFSSVPKLFKRKGRFYYMNPPEETVYTETPGECKYFGSPRLPPKEINCSLCVKKVVCWIEASKELGKTEK